MLGELIGEFTGKNTVSRVLPDGKIEVSNQGTGKLLGLDAFIVSTAVTTTMNGTYMGEVNSVITTMDGSSIMLRGTAVSWASEKGGTTRAGTIQMTTAAKLMPLVKMMLVHEYETDMMNNWVGKIWEWK